MTEKDNQLAELPEPVLRTGKFSGPGEKPVAVLMSGGVDSAVTAAILKREGFQAVGVTMLLLLDALTENDNREAAQAAAGVCDKIGIPHFTVDIRKPFMKKVIEPFREGYLEGKTPSPCVLCNRQVKFGMVWDTVERHLGISEAATGHYARVVTSGDKSLLKRGADHSRDQSYFLAGLKAKRLPGLKLPLGEKNKDEVRKTALELGLKVAEVKDSQDVCFLGGRDYRELLENMPTSPGPILSPEGKKIGRHTGLHHYTIGQRKGLGALGPEPHYVLGINPKQNTITAGRRNQAYTHRVRARLLEVHQPEKIKPDAELFGKIRSSGDPGTCRVAKNDSETVTVDFKKACFAPSPGQFLVLYDSDETVAACGEITPQPD